MTFVAHNVDPFPKLAQAVQNDLKAVGIDASIKLMDKATYWDYISLPQSHMAIGLTDWYQDFPDPSDFVGPLYTHPIEGGANASFYTNPEVEALYKASNTELDPAKRIEMFVQMQDIIMGDAPVRDPVSAGVQRDVRQERRRLLLPPGLEPAVPGDVEARRQVRR